MTSETLIELLKKHPGANIQIKRKVIVNDNGFNRQIESWVDLDEAQVNTTKFGGNTIFIGDL